MGREHRDYPMLAEHFLQKVGVGTHGGPIDADVGAHCGKGTTAPFVDAETRCKLRFGFEG